MKRFLNWTAWSRAQRHPEPEPDWTDWLVPVTSLVAVALLWWLT
jgi:hypothetical protein